MQSFVLNRNGRLVFPSNVFSEIDFSVIRDQDQLDQVVRRDFETKAPTGTEMLRRIETGTYADRYQLMRDMALNLFWTNRFAATMYDKQPTRWRDVPRRRDDVFLPGSPPGMRASARSRRSRAHTERCRSPGMPKPRPESSRCSSTCSVIAGTTRPSCRH